MAQTILSSRFVTPVQSRSWSCVPSSGAAILTTDNTPVTVVGTITTSVLASTNYLTQVRTTLFSTGTTAGALASLRQAQTEFWRGGGTAGRGGFFIQMRIGLNTLQSGQRGFFGISDVVTAPTNIDPTTSATPGKVGLAFALNTGNWKLVTNVTGSAPTVTDLGANFPINTTDLLELVLFCGPNDSQISYKVTNLTSGNITQGQITTNLPANTTFLTLAAWVTNNATAASVIMAINKIYVEVPN